MSYPCPFTPSNRVYACWLAVTIQSGPPNLVGQYEAHGKMNGKMKYRNIATGATMQFDSKQKRWILVLDDKGSKTQYSSLDNANRNVPWSKSVAGRFKMSGKSWQLDEGEYHSSPLEFDGMHAPAFTSRDHQKSVMK